MSVPILILVGWLAMALVMAWLWLVQRKRHNAGIVDIAWSFGTGLLAVGFAAGTQGDPARRTLVAMLAGLWGARLGFHLLRRVLCESEDGRYQMIRQRFGDRTQVFLFWFFQIQAVWAVMFALPMLAAASHPVVGLRWHDFAGLAVWLVAVGGEAVADRQLAGFRAQPTNLGKVCRAGLWRYSRHPNYFFEWVHWFAYIFIAWGSPWWWVTWTGVVVMLLFLTKVTGVPFTEMRALQSRGEAYREYQRTTSVFIPLPPRSGGESE